MITAGPLPKWPSKGNRRKLEERWLDVLERDGLAAFLPVEPTLAPPELETAIEQFNRREFWECHETLEAVWLATPYPLRFFYHAIIKTAVGFHHLSRHNRHGATVKLADGVRLLRLFPREYMGVPTKRLLDDVVPWLERLEPSARLDWSTLDSQPLPTILWALHAMDPG